ncbi:MAG TPA: response regulator transcription factor [Bryobacteraceae bacterium]|nr:response regulator transcription factor [Bryobacteraceae bacterium]
MPAPTRILLIDDHSLFREAVARLLGGEPEFEVVGQCATVEEGLGVLRSSPADIVLLDINLGSQQGGAFVPQARAVGYSGKILVVTAGVSRVEAERLMRRGCAGIVLKQERPELLIERIRAVMSGAVSPANQSAVLEDLDVPGREPAVRFTPRERQIMRGVFAGQTNKEIAGDLGISEPLVKAVMQQLFEKTGVRTRAQLVRTAIERYWKELEEDDA